MKRPAFTCLAVFSVLAGATQAAEPTVEFNRDVRPILSKNCFACHGADKAQRARSLRLDERDSAVKPRKNVTAIVPGQPNKSELVRRITAADEAERMPPKETGNHLTPDQIVTLTRWIKEGAVYADWWAFVKPVQRPLPQVNDRSWPKNGLDFFVLSRLEKAGLKPNEPADKFTLLRRASLDLRGLPPSPKEVDDFAADTSPDAYEKAVDRFLQDASFGERWARMWLDLARYADSAGYGSDPLRPNMWRYRDWVIDAFNKNLPFDRFTVEQLAGDLLPDATLEQRIATAFHRNTMTNTEGGTDDEEFRVAAVKDRVDTTMQVWMGLTMGCAKCHTHKYDPISNQEYYRFIAVFNQTADNDQPNEAPTLSAPTAEQAEQSRRIDAQIAELKRQLDAPSPQLDAEQKRWEDGLQLHSEWTVLEPLTMKSEGGATLKKQGDGSVRVEGANPANDTFTLTTKTALKGITAFRLEAIPDASLAKHGSGRAADGNFVLSHFSVTMAAPSAENKPVVGRHVRVEIPGDGKILSLAEVQVFSRGENLARGGKATQSSTDYDGPANLAIDGNTDGDFYRSKSVTHTRAEANPWWEVTLAASRPLDSIALWNRTDNGTGVRLANFRVSILDDSRKVVWQQQITEPPSPKRELSPSGTQTVVLTQAAADFSQDKFPVGNALTQAKLEQSGWAVGPLVDKPHAAVFVTAAPLTVPPDAVLTFRLDHRFHMPNFTLGRFRLAAGNDPRVLDRAKVPAEILAILNTSRSKRSAEQAERLRRHFRSSAPSLQKLRDDIARLEKSKPAVAMLPVMVELPAKERRQTRIMIKGNFLNLGDPVEPGVPAAFHPLRDSHPLGPNASGSLSRLDVARWLVDPNNPLMARVAVNRFWGQLWGAGLVRTEEDFGTQGELPSHPELLDWLAVEFMKQKWNVKAFLKLLVTSATYRQSSRVTPEVLKADPYNRLLTRGPRFRLEAEMVRDQALALSGLLSRKIGGPSVYPPQPDGLWQAAFNGERTWATSKGEDRYRRGLYTFWRRTVPYPSMATFDAPSREICTVRRVRTNTPLQAFVTLNDPVYVESAQALARRIVKEGGANAEERARFGLKLCLCRPPQPEQVQRVLTLFQSEFEHYRKNPKEAAALATEPLGPLPAGMNAGELAAWTVVANVFLNLDGVLTKG